MKVMTTVLSALIVCLAACSTSGNTANGNPGNDTAATITPPEFSGDSAYALVERQCDFGPRVPGTDAHRKCGDWIEATLAALCDTAVTQQAQVTTFDGKKLDIRNFIGTFNPEAGQRILLAAHWDCRPWADKDPDPAKRNQPVMGANDAASGVAVLLELARLMNAKQPNIGIDILITDAEDWGSDGDENSWALGTQYWAANPHTPGYHATFGILLDMVGAKGARFAPEYFSTQYAPTFVQKVWSAASKAGFNAYFASDQGGAVTDDHIFINTIAGIPCIDIIDMRPDNTEGGFFSAWHTTDDVISNIDTATLRAVGQTITNVIYQY